MPSYLSHEERFFVATKCCIFAGWRILVVREKTKDNAHWDLPWGKISKEEKDADVISSLERELFEELWDAFWVKENSRLFYVQKAYEKAFHSDDILPFVFLCYFLELDEVPKITLSDEHTVHQWIDISEIATLHPWRAHFDVIVQKAFEFKNI